MSLRGRHVVGIDVGGTNLRVSLAREDGEIIDRRHRDTEPEGLAADGIKALGEMIEELAAANDLRLSGIGSCGVGVPGPTDPDKGILYDPPHLPGWHNVEVARLLEEATGIPTHLENDAQLAAYGEFHRGAGRGSRHLVFVTISTGIGGGIVIDGRLYSGASGSAGEIGHVMVDPDGPVCSCGRRGHLEGLASGTSMARIARERIAAGENSSLASLDTFTAQEIGEAAGAGDALAISVLTNAGRLLGLTFGGLLNILDPEVLILGGGVVQIGAVLLDPLYAAIKEQAFEANYSHARITTAGLGQDAGLVGAVEWAIDHLPGGRPGPSAASPGRPG
ncbi:MAG TPA: ROK family protein [Candidatus Solibacter sp.]|nr:ROK family protein [Candidatus Solibacter sp.]